MVIRRVSRLFVLGALLVPSSDHRAFGSEFGQTERGEVLFRAVRLALAIQPPPIVEILNLTSSLSWMRLDARAPLEALYRDVRDWAAGTESADDYRKAAEAARFILSRLGTIAPERVDGLSDTWPERPDSMAAYDRFERQVKADSSTRQILKGPPTGFLDVEVPAEFSLITWLNVIGRLKYQGNLAQAHLAFQRAIAQYEDPGHFPNGTPQLWQLVQFVGADLPEDLPSVFESYLKSMKSMRMAYELTMDGNTIALAFYEAKALELILSVKSNNPRIADGLLDRTPASRKRSRRPEASILSGERAR